MNQNMKAFFAELFGTFVLVLMGTGAAVLSGGNILVTAFAFGISVITMAFAVGHISGGHFNPAVSFGMYLRKKIELNQFGIYVLAQIVGATIASAFLVFIFSSSAALGQNVVNATLVGSDFSGLLKGLLVEVVLTFIFVSGIIGVTRSENTQPYAGFVIGFMLMGVNFLGFTITGVSVNPARSFGPAIFAGGDALSQLWIFILGPLLGGGLAALVAKVFD